MTRYSDVQLLKTGRLKPEVIADSYSEEQILDVLQGDQIGQAISSEIAATLRKALEIQAQEGEMLDDAEITYLDEEGENPTVLNFDEITYLDEDQESRINNLSQRSNELIACVKGYQSPGIEKGENQDYILATKDLIIACDGVGSGDNSAQIALDVAHQFNEDFQLLQFQTRNEDNRRAYLQGILDEINQYIIRTKKMNNDSDSGTTFTSVISISDTEKYIVSLGDSQVFKFSKSGELSAVSNPTSDSFIPAMFDKLGIRYAGEADLPYNEFINALNSKLSLLNVDQNSQQAKTMQQFRQMVGDETKFLSMRQAMVKGFGMEGQSSTQLSPENAKTVTADPYDTFLCMTDGVTDQMTEEQMQKVFTLGAIKELIKNHELADATIKGLESTRIQELSNNDVITVGNAQDLSSDLQKILKHINPKKLFRKQDPQLLAKTKELMAIGGIRELEKEALANMQEQRLHKEGYKRAKGDNVGIVGM